MKSMLVVVVGAGLVNLIGTLYRLWSADRWLSLRDYPDLNGLWAWMWRTVLVTS